MPDIVQEPGPPAMACGAVPRSPSSIPSRAQGDGAITIGTAPARCRILGLRGVADIRRGAWNLSPVRVRAGSWSGVVDVMNSVSRERPYVVYWNNLPAPYMIERFNALADRGNLDFEAWFSGRDDSRRSWTIDENTWRFRYRYVPRVKAAGTVWRLPPIVMGRRPDVLVSLYAEPVYLAGWATAKMLGSRTAFWCVSTSDAWVKRSVWKDRVKRFVFPRVDATLGPGETSRAFAMQFGVPAERAWVLHHAIDVDHFVSGREHALPRRETTRSDLGLVGTVFIYVGRLWEGKGVFHLLEAFERVQREHPEPVSLLLVGDGPDADRIALECDRRGLRNVVFAGFRMLSLNALEGFEQVEYPLALPQPADIDEDRPHQTQVRPRRLSARQRVLTARYKVIDVDRMMEHPGPFRRNWDYLHRESSTRLAQPEGVGEHEPLDAVLRALQPRIARAHTPERRGGPRRPASEVDRLRGQTDPRIGARPITIGGRRHTVPAALTRGTSR